MEFARINPSRDAENVAAYHVEYDGELMFHEESAIEMDFLGMESATAKRAVIRHGKRLSKMKQRGKKERSFEDYSDEEIASRKKFVENSNALFYADVLAGWRNVTHIPSGEEGGEIKLLKYTPEAAIDLLTKAVWLHEGIEVFLENKSNWRKNTTAS
jgi:hypothetical protein